MPGRQGVTEAITVPVRWPGELLVVVWTAGSIVGETQTMMVGRGESLTRIEN